MADLTSQNHERLRVAKKGDSSRTAGTCFPDSLPFNGDLLPIMPWPSLRHMTDHDLRAIYEYLKAIPCIAGPPTGVLHNDCT